MRLLDWIKSQKDLNLVKMAPSIGINVSNLSKIARGLIWVSGETADRIREFTDGEVTLDDMHDAWREAHPTAPPPRERISA